MLGQALPPLRQFGEFDDFRLIGIHSARFLPFQGGQLALSPGAFVLRPYIHGRIAVALCILLP